jgi:cytochrome P450
MTDTRPKAEDFQFGSPEVNACPYPFYDAVRAHCPVYQLPGRPDVLLTRYDDVRQAAHHHEVYSSHRPSAAASTDPEIAAIEATGYPTVPALVTLDPPEHTRIRRLLSRSFSAKVIAEMEPSVAAVVDSLIDTFVERGTVEFMEEFALPFPTRVIGDAFGIPVADQGNFRQWSDAIADLVSLYISRERMLECKRSIVEMQHYFAALVEQRKAEPGDDLLSAFVNARVEGERPLELLEILELIRIFLAGGNETTASLLGSAMYLLLTHPEQMAAVRADHSLIPQMLEETLRFESPVQWNPRTIERDDAECNGTPLPSGTRVLLSWGAANRDPEKFGPDAGRFDIHRPSSDHLAFGHGVHFCVGAGLGRMEARVAFERLFSRLDEIKLAVSPEEIRYVGAFTRRLERLPLSVSGR